MNIYYYILVLIILETCQFIMFILIMELLGNLLNMKFYLCLSRSDYIYYFIAQYLLKISEIKMFMFN